MCGICAVYLFDHTKKAAHMLHQMLLSQANRMNYSAGVAVYDEQRENDHIIISDRGLGPIETAFGLEHEVHPRLEELVGYAGIGQGRYATSNANRIFTRLERLAMAQPYRNNDDVLAKNFAFAFNGNVANFEDLHEELRGEPEGYHIRTRTDTEVLRILLKKGISKALQGVPTKSLDAEAFKDILAEMNEKVIGAYSLVFIDGKGNLLLARDPAGTRPLVYTMRDFGFLAASEPTAFYDQGITSGIMDVQPGHFIVINRDHKLTDQIPFASPQPGICIFERVYFSHALSEFDGMSTYEFRRRQGIEMALVDRDILFTEDDYITCIPETSRPFVDGYVEGCLQLEKRPPIPMEAVIKRKHYRSFMEDSPGSRKDKVRAKFQPVRRIAEGKRLYVADDSIVRGDVMGTLLSVIREEVRPEEIHLRIAYDQYRHPCYRGIDTPEPDALLASRFGGDIERMREFLGVDSLKFLPIATNVRMASGLGKKSPGDWCTGCADGNYPTEYEKRLAGIVPVTALTEHRA